MEGQDGLLSFLHPLCTRHIGGSEETQISNPHYEKDTVLIQVVCFYYFNASQVSQCIWLILLYGTSEKWQRATMDPGIQDPDGSLTFLIMFQHLK